MSLMKTLPVFVTPTTVKFILNVEHKKLITIFNPFDFPIKFKVTSNAPSKYLVSHPEGRILPNCMFDVIIRHALPAISNCGTVDKFRISVVDSKTQEISGKYEIDAILIESQENGQMENENDYCNFNNKSKIETECTRSKKMFVLAATVLIMAALVILPFETDDEKNSTPDHIYRRMYIKIFCSFLTGVIACYFLFSLHDYKTEKCDKNKL